MRVQKPFKRAFGPPLTAADHGDIDAQVSLGVMYFLDDDYMKAKKWYRLAADQGDPRAQNSLAMMYEVGQGGPQDFKEAVKWYRLAADQGYADAQFKVGEGYYYGTGGTPQDHQEAMKWYRLAAEQGDDFAKTKLLRLENEKIVSDQVVAKPYLDATFDKVNTSPYDMHKSEKGEHSVFGFLNWFILVILISVPALGLLPAFIAKNKGRNFILWWLYGTVLFFVAFIHSLLLKEDAKFIEAKALAGGGRKCPYCAEIVKAEAVVCRFCHKDLPPPKFSGETGLYS